MMPFRIPEEKPDEVQKMMAISLVARIENGAKKILRSRLDKMLSRKMNLYERCGAYVLHSFNVLIQSGASTEEVLERHADIVEMITEIKRKNLERLDADGRD